MIDFENSFVFIVRVMKHIFYIFVLFISCEEMSKIFEKNYEQLDHKLYL